MSDDDLLMSSDEEMDEETRRLEEEIRRLEEERLAEEADDLEDDEDLEEERLRKLQEEIERLEREEDEEMPAEDEEMPAASTTPVKVSVKVEGATPGGTPSRRGRVEDQDDSALQDKLDMKWDEFEDSLTPVEKPKEAKLEDHYDETQMSKFKQEGSVILNALKAKDEASKKEGKEAGWDKVIPAYLRGVMGVGEAKKESAHVPKHYFDIFRRANPDIVKKAEYEDLFGECAEEDATGSFIWRMEMFLPIEVDADMYPSDEDGRLLQLNSEDCYVMLHITAESTGKVFSIFNWIGEDASLDKRGASAIRSQELNLYLHGRAKLRTEWQGFESEPFRECFGEVDMLYEEGAESGFKPPDKPKLPVRLYRLTLVRPSIVGYPIPEKKDSAAAAADKPGRRPRLLVSMSEVEKVYDVFNKSDCFLLDTGNDRQMFVWFGSKAPTRLRWAAVDTAARINMCERASGMSVHEIGEGGEAEAFKDDDGNEWSMLDYVDVGDVTKLPERGEPYIDDIILYRTALDDSGKVKLPKVRDGPDDGVLTRDMLMTDSVVLLDAFSELYVWMGDKSHSRKLKLRKVVTSVANNLARQEDRPPGVQVIPVYEGAEPLCFISKFPQWYRDSAGRGMRSNYTRPLPWQVSLAPARERFRFDPRALGGSAELPTPYMPDSGSGSVEVWAVEDGRPTFTKLPASERGEFYTGDCFLVMYTFHNKNDRMRQAYVLYFWEGREASNRWWPAFWYGFFPVLQRKIRNAGGRPPYVEHVYEHEEPEHFMLLFGDAITIHKGHRRSRPKRDAKRLYHVRRTFDMAHCVEVAPEARMLNSFDSFALLTADKLYLWYGKGVGYEESQAVVEVVEALQDGRELVQIDQGDEEAAFWNLLGGWVELPCGEEFYNKYKDHPRRLYTFSESSGALTVEQQPRWSQMLLRLRDADCFMLDTHHEVYVLCGRQASESLAVQTLAAARTFVRAMARDRKLVVDLHYTKTGERPPEHMTRHFHTWVHESAFVDPDIARTERLREAIFELYKDAEAERNDERQIAMQERALSKLKRVDMQEVARREIEAYEELQKRMAAHSKDASARADEAYQGTLSKLRAEETAEQVDYAIDAGSDDEDVLARLDSDEEEQQYDDVHVEKEVVKEKKSAADEYVERYAKSTRHGRIYERSDDPADIARQRRRR